MDDQSCQDFDRQRSWLVVQRFPDLGFRKGDVEKGQMALQDGRPPGEQIFRRCPPMGHGDGGERLRPRGCEASR